MSTDSLPAGLAIRTATPDDFPALHAALDRVARERRYLAIFTAPPLERSVAFYQGLLDEGLPLQVLVRGTQILGWCDICGLFGDTRVHIGVLGIGLLPEARGQGLGGRLMQSALDAAWARGLTRIELSVRTDNTRAARLYERLGFEHEGIKRQACLVDGVYHDIAAMALLREPTGARAASTDGGRPRLTRPRP